VHRPITWPPPISLCAHLQLLLARISVSFGSQTARTPLRCHQPAKTGVSSYDFAPTAVSRSPCHAASSSLSILVCTALALALWTSHHLICNYPYPVPSAHHQGSRLTDSEETHLYGISDSGSGTQKFGYVWTHICQNPRGRHRLGHPDYHIAPPSHSLLTCMETP